MKRVSLGLFLLALALRVPFRSEYAYHWDGAQFALAVADYDLSAGVPQAPGFPLYVALGKLVNVFVGDPHASLVWLSVLAGAALPALGYALGRSMGGPVAGWATGLILLTSPLAWFHSEVALTNIVDAALVTATALAAWRVWQYGATGTRMVTLALLMAAVAGVRPQSAVPLLGLWLVAVGRQRGWRLGAVALLVAGIAAWLVPLVWLTGGWEKYRELIQLKAAYDLEKTWWGGGWPAVGDSLQVIGSSLWVGLLLAVPFAAVGLWRADRNARLVLLLWVVPMVAAGVVAYTTMPGYVLSYLPALAVFAGLGVARWRTAPVLIAAMTAINALAFLAAPGRSTAAAIRAHDRVLAGRLAGIREQYPPDETVLVHRGEWFAFGFRQFQYHLPEYRNVLLTPDESLPGERGRQLWLGWQGRTEFVDRVPAAAHVVEINGADGSHSAN